MLLKTGKSEICRQVLAGRNLCLEHAQICFDSSNARTVWSAVIPAESLAGQESYGSCVEVKTVVGRREGRLGNEKAP